MAASARINPRTGRRYNYVDPKKAERDARASDAELALLRPVERDEEFLGHPGQGEFPDPEHGLELLVRG